MAPLKKKILGKMPQALFEWDKEEEWKPSIDKRPVYCVCVDNASAAILDPLDGDPLWKEGACVRLRFFGWQHAAMFVVCWMTKLRSGEELVVRVRTLVEIGFTDEFLLEKTTTLEKQEDDHLLEPFRLGSKVAAALHSRCYNLLLQCEKQDGSSKELLEELVKCDNECGKSEQGGPSGEV